MKRYSAKERYKYHRSRDKACGKHGLKYGGSKHCYSSGFVDGFTGVNNIDGITHEFGKRSGNAYILGLKRGKKASREYLHQTGKNPYHIEY